MILVVGGRGRSGKPVVDHLLAMGESVKVLTRNPAHPVIVDFIQRGVQIVHGDLQKSETIKDIFSEVTHVYYISSSENGICEEIIAAKNFIDRAKEKRIEHFVFQSVLFSETKLPHCAVKGIVDEYLAQSGLPYSILSPGIFFETLQDSLKLIVTHVLAQTKISSFDFVNSLPLETELPWTYVDDIGKVAAALLTKTGPINQSVSVFSSPLVSMNEMAEFLSSILKKNIIAQRQLVKNIDFKPILIGEKTNCPPVSYLLESPESAYYMPIENWKYVSSKYENAEKIMGTPCTSVEEALVECLKVLRS